MQRKSSRRRRCEEYQVIVWLKKLGLTLALTLRDEPSLWAWCLVRKSSILGFASTGSR
jgi:hypothetical protein